MDWIATDHVVTRATGNTSGLQGSAYVRQGNDVYALAVLFAAHTGVRAGELQGLQLQDVTLSDIPGTVGSIRVVRTATRKGRQWQYGTPKSDASADRVVPLAPWLADELRDYLTAVHPFNATNAAGNKYIPHAPLSPVDAIAMCSIGLSRCAPRACMSTIFSRPARLWLWVPCDSTICGTPSPP